MNHAANSSWLRNRYLIARPAISQAAAFHFTGVRAWTPAVVEAVRFAPSWIYLAMILVATAAICITVNLRGYSQMRWAALQFQQMESKVSALQRSNAALELEILRMTREPATIESAARVRLGMVRPTDIVVPLQSRSDTNLATMAFVR